MKWRDHGYTMVELIVVMVVLGIISAIAIPRLMGNDMAGPAFRAEVVSALRYAQKTAVSHRRLVCATVTSGAVTLSIASASGAAACNTPLSLPDGSDSYSSKDSAVTATATTLYFQPAGTITSDGAGTATTAGSIAITGLTSIAIQGATGYVE
ncbi:prepilin-type N-terminal cleavage/methylation domain-containing protein [Duganella sp. FT92W]|uniref:Type II secretion system protein H n=1 Tax=Pseudoduganella rivuli TaxID=2666085 RepID=A0A7X2IKF6_9BURK|nr:GspH/FimT family pseudopilin [Pseudoduganella rivuli]MRV71486.1 prepilin-type N-terminal cleavage/methylation domain-containing protein [Pseudoduganella rivuli]